MPRQAVVVLIRNLSDSTGEENVWFARTGHRVEAQAIYQINARSGFCSECGSSIFWHPKDQPNIAIAAGSLDSPTNLKTIGHIWCSQISDFYKIEDDLPQFEERWIG